MNVSIICIDDDRDTEAGLSRLVSAATPEFNPEFHFARDDETALALLHSDTRFDVALVNIDGGATSGMQLFRKLMEPSLRVPRVALTDGADIERIRQAIADGATDIIVKPLVGDDVVSTLSRVIEKVERRRRNWRERSAYSALRREVDIAADMQRRVLPTRFPKQAELDFHASMQPARGIGGDFYDVFAIDADRVAFLIADVSGKGIPAAFYMAIASTALRSVAMTGATPARCLMEVNEFLAGRGIPGMFVSVFYGVVDVHRWQLSCANAGHSPPLLRDGPGGGLNHLEAAGGPVLGILPGQEYEQSELPLQPGSLVLLYTDGVTEAWNEERNLFGDDRLVEAVQKVNGGSPAAVLDAVDDTITAFVRDAEQHDDITALAVRRQA